MRQFTGISSLGLSLYDPDMSPNDPEVSLNYLETSLNDLGMLLNDTEVFPGSVEIPLNSLGTGNDLLAMSLNCLDGELWFREVMFKDCLINCIKKEYKFNNWVQRVYSSLTFHILNKNLIQTIYILDSFRSTK